MTDMMPRVTTPQPHHYRDWKSWGAALTVSLMEQDMLWEGMEGQREEERTELQTRLTDIETDATGTASALETLSTDVQLIDDRLVVTSQQTTDLKAEVENARSGSLTLTARLSILNQARIDGDTAEATARSILEAEIRDARGLQPNLLARITQVDTARVDGDTALATRATKLEAEITNARGGLTSLTARISQVDEARVSGDTALATRTTNLEAEVTNARSGHTTLLSRVTQVDTARAEGDNALASQDTVIMARADEGTATGKIRIVAEAGPAGYSAQYSWQLSVNGNAIGMYAMQDGSGFGSISFVANNFRLTDPSYNGGSPQQVFAYAAGRFEFFIPVRVKSLDIEDGAINGFKIADLAVVREKIGNSAVDNPKIENNAVSNMPNAGGVTWAEVTLTTRSSSKILIIGSFNPTNTGDQSEFATRGLIRIYRISGGVSTILATIPHPRDLVSTSTGQFQAEQIFHVDTPGAGTFTYGADTTNNAGIGNMDIFIIDLSK